MAIQFFNILKNKKLLLLIIFILVLVLGFIFKPKNHPQKAIKVQKGSIVENTYGIGTVTANQRFQIKLGVTSTITKIYVKEGDSVKTGEKLITLDSDTVFTAPFDGVVVSLPFKIGETVFPQTVILDFLNLSDRYVVVSLEQRSAIRVSKGLKVKLSFDGLRDQTFLGQVDAVYSNGTDFLVRINVDNLPSFILPGMTADVAIAISVHENALLVPITAIDKNIVYLISNPKRPIVITTGLVDEESAEVLSGDLHENDELVVSK